MSTLKNICSTLYIELSSCAGESTAHAVPRLLNQDERKILRLFWLIAWLAAVSFFLTHLLFLFNTFLSDPVTTSINYNKVTFIFPDVTICSLIPYSYRYLERYEPEKMKELANLTLAEI